MRSIRLTTTLVGVLVSLSPIQGQLAGENDIATKETDKHDIVAEVGVVCNSQDITLRLTVSSQYFNGMIYPKGLSKNSTCMTEYIQQKGIITYSLPLRSCNTMSTDVSEGQEYFNTVVVQPHRKLVTNQGRGYHVRCRYQTQEKTLTNDARIQYAHLLWGSIRGEGGRECEDWRSTHSRHQHRRAGYIRYARDTVFGEGRTGLE